MNKKTFWIVAFAALICADAHAGVKRFFEEIRVPGQVVMQRQNFGAPIATDTSYVKLDFAGPTSASALVVTSFDHQPDVPRNITITPGSTTGDVESCTVTVAGTNILGRNITEDFAFAANASSATTGAKAFKSITSVTWPANCESGGFAASWKIGVGEKIGINRCLDYAGDWVFSEVGGAYESTRATVTADADEVEKNVADFNGTMNGSNVFLGHFVQNFRCLP